MNRCPPPPCEDPKSTSYRTETTLVGYGPTGYWHCFEEPWEYDYYDGYYYDEYQYTYKDTKIKRTEYCDGTVTEEVVEVTYRYAYCFESTYLICYYPVNWPPLCY